MAEGFQGAMTPPVCSRQLQPLTVIQLPTRLTWRFLLSLLSAAGCTFDQDSDPGFCDYRQGQDDDFDWQLIRTYNWPHPTPDLLRGTIST